MNRLLFASVCAMRHLLVSVLVAMFVAVFVFYFLYPAPYAEMLGVGTIFALLLGVDVVCGPLLTLVLASPLKSIRERWLDFTVIGIVQLAALLFGIHSLWLARPAVLAFEQDRLVVVSANEVDLSNLHAAPAGLQRLPFWGQLRVATRQPQNGNEYFSSIEQSLAGISPAMRPGWWLPWELGTVEMARRAKPVVELRTRRPESAVVLQKAVANTGIPMERLSYLPLTSHKNKEWIVLLDEKMNLVGYASIDGF